MSDKSTKQHHQSSKPKVQSSGHANDAGSKENDLKKPRQFGKKQTKQPSMKNVIRSLKRLLAKPDLPADMRAAKEAQLAKLEDKKEQKFTARKEQTIASKYHKIKFFERVKVERRIKQLERQLAEVKSKKSGKQDKSANSDSDVDSSSSESESESDSNSDEKLSADEIQASLAKWKSDLDYINLYPKGLKYVALFPKASTPEAQAQLDTQRNQIRDLIAQAKQLSTSAGTLLAASAKLNDDKASSSSSSTSTSQPSSSSVLTFSQAAAKFKNLAASFVSSGMQLSDDEDSDDENGDSKSSFAKNKMQSKSQHQHQQKQSFKQKGSNQAQPSKSNKFHDDDDQDNHEEAEADDDFFLAGSDDDDGDNQAPRASVHKRKRGDNGDDNENQNNENHNNHRELNSERNHQNNKQYRSGGFHPQQNGRGRGRGGFGAPRQFNRSFGAASKFLQHDKADREKQESSGSGGFRPHRGGFGGRGGGRGGFHNSSTGSGNNNHRGGRGGFRPKPSQ